MVTFVSLSHSGQLQNLSPAQQSLRNSLSLSVYHPTPAPVLLPALSSSIFFFLIFPALFPHSWLLSLWFLSLSSYLVPWIFLSSASLNQPQKQNSIFSDLYILHEVFYILNKKTLWAENTMSLSEREETHLNWVVLYGIICMRSQRALLWGLMIPGCSWTVPSIPSPFSWGSGSSHIKPWHFHAYYSLMSYDTWLIFPSCYDSVIVIILPLQSPSLL